MVGFWMSSKRPFEFVLGQAFFFGGCSYGVHGMEIYQTH